MRNKNVGRFALALFVTLLAPLAFGRVSEFGAACLDSNENLYTVSPNAGMDWTVDMLSSSGLLQWSVPLLPPSGTTSITCSDMVVDPAGNYVYLECLAATSSTTNEIVVEKLDATSGNLLQSVSYQPAQNATILTKGIGLDTLNHVYVLFQNGTSAGPTQSMIFQYSTSLGSPLSYALASPQGGNVYATDLMVDSLNYVLIGSLNPNATGGPQLIVTAFTGGTFATGVFWQRQQAVGSYSLTGNSAGDGCLVEDSRDNILYLAALGGAGVYYLQYTHSGLVQRRGVDTTVAATSVTSAAMSPTGNVSPYLLCQVATPGHPYAVLKMDLGGGTEWSTFATPTLTYSSLYQIGSLSVDSTGNALVADSTFHGSTAASSVQVYNASDGTFLLNAQDQPSTGTSGATHVIASKLTASSFYVHGVTNTTSSEGRIMWMFDDSTNTRIWSF